MNDYIEVSISFHRVKSGSKLTISLKVFGWCTRQGADLCEMGRIGACLDPSWRCEQLYFMTGLEAGNQLDFNYDDVTHGD